MKYTYTKEVNRYVTPICSAPGNGGIHDASQFVSAVGMLEQAIGTWTSPRLLHITLTWATVPAYAQFIDHMKRYMPRKAYKAAVEVDSFKGQHVHWMLIIDSSSPDNLFDMDDDSSPACRVMAQIQRTEPEFTVTVAQPYKYPATPFIPLRADTLQDAADWFSYALKARSKPPVGSGGCYWSSRSAKRVCPSHRPARPVKQNHLFDSEF